MNHATLERMPSSIGVERTGPSIRAVLAEHAADRCAEFEAEFRIALAEADDDFDLGRVQAVIDKWWPIAYSVLHPPTAEERKASALNLGEAERVGGQPGGAVVLEALASADQSSRRQSCGRGRR